MATQPHTSTPAPAQATAPPPVPGGMASDPAVAVANEIVSAIKGAMEQARLEAASKVSDSMVADIAKTIRTFVNNEVAKATSEMHTPTPPPSPSNAAKK